MYSMCPNKHISRLTSVREPVGLPQTDPDAGDEVVVEDAVRDVAVYRRLQLAVRLHHYQLQTVLATDAICAVPAQKV